MKIILNTIFFISLSISFAIAQVQISIPQFSGGFLKADLLWNVVVSNPQNAVYGIVQLTIRNNKHNIVFDASSTEVEIPKGTKLLSNNYLSPITINSNNSDINGWLPVGKYYICYQITGITHGEKITFGQDCSELNIEPLTPPLLVQPTDKSELYENRPLFSWITPTPLQIFPNVNYELKVVEKFKGQSAVQAIKTNSPVYFENGLTTISKTLPASYQSLSPNHQYVWQVTAYNNNYSIKSEYWEFKIIEDSVKKIIENAPFVYMDLNRSELSVMHQDYLKIYLNNYTSDTTAKMCISEEGAPQKGCLINVNLIIKPGENYILKFIGKEKKLDDKKVYQVIWTNSLNEKRVLRFSPKYYY